MAEDWICSQPDCGLLHSEHGKPPQKLYVVLGGELVSTGSLKFKDMDAVDVCEVLLSSYESARDEWKARSQRTVDNALIRYFIIPVDLSQALARNDI